MNKPMIQLRRTQTATRGAEAFVGGKEKARHRMSVDVPETLHRQANVFCAERGVSLSNVVASALEAYLAAQRTEP
jgi:hypothetical protein